MTILYRRCKLPESYAKKLVAVMKELQVHIYYNSWDIAICYCCNLLYFGSKDLVGNIFVIFARLTALLEYLNC